MVTAKGARRLASRIGAGRGTGEVLAKVLAWPRLPMSTPRLARWLPWVTGIAALAVLVLVVLNVTEERAFLQLLEQSQPRWLLLALAFQAFTYIAQAEVWRLVLHRAGTGLRWSFACRLSLAKLFMDQAIPSMGVSGAVLVTQALQERGAARGAVLSSVSIDTAAFYLAYIVNLAVALALLAAAGHAVPLILALGVFFLLYSAALATVVLVLSGRQPGRLARGLLRIPGLRRILAVLQDADPRLAHDPALLSRATALQILVAVADAATLWALLHALGVDASGAAVFSSFLIASVLRSIGVLPGGLGTFEAGSVGALTFAGVPIAAALAATLMFRVVSFWLPMLPGLAFTRALGQRSAARTNAGIPRPVGRRRIERPRAGASHVAQGRCAASGPAPRRRPGRRRTALGRQHRAGGQRPARSHRLLRQRSRAHRRELPGPEDSRCRRAGGTARCMVVATAHGCRTRHWSASRHCRSAWRAPSSASRWSTSRARKSSRRASIAAGCTSHPAAPPDRQPATAS